MKRLLSLLILMMVTSSLAAHKRTGTANTITGDAALDSLLVQVEKRTEWFVTESVGKLELTADVHATSYSTNHQWWTKLCHDLLPFDPREGKMTELDAICKASYQTPCDLQITPLVLISDNRRRSRTILKELNQILLPIYDLKLMRNKGDDKDYIQPFSKLGLRRYNFESVDTTVIGQDSILTIRFWPKTRHHDLFDGEADIRLQDYFLSEYRIKGNIDFGTMCDTVRFGLVNGYWMMKSSSVDLIYKYGKMHGYNHFDYSFDVKQLLPKKAFDPRFESLDLSNVYQTQPSDFISTDTTNHAADSTARQLSRGRRFIQKLPQRMVSSTSFEALNSDFRIYGPLNPAFIGYDKINGLTFRERMRFSHLFQNGQSIRIYPEVGYALRLKQFRYQFNTEWTYSPEHRGSLTLRLHNGSAGFPSRFRHGVNKMLKQYQEEMDWNKDKKFLSSISFESLRLRYFNRYIFSLENSIELATGLQMHTGIEYNIRKPVQHGVYALLDTLTDMTIENRYLDMTPYLRLEWTPRQYYYMEGRQKLYLKSQWPTFTFEVGHGVKNVLKSRANFVRLELDTHQTLPIGNSRSISWRFGGGGFFKQDEEYFVNYSFFSRSQYPSTWDRRSNGGNFSLLDDYWYSSSRSYVQGHFMFDTPFLMLHRWSLISRYVVRERIYSSFLWAQSKHPYGELGYGIGNNYFNASLFCGFMGKHPFDIGAKFSIELDQHL